VPQGSLTALLSNHPPAHQPPTHLKGEPVGDELVLLQLVVLQLVQLLLVSGTRARTRAREWVREVVGGGEGAHARVRVRVLAR
jgi:hypothetical protein